MNLKTIIRNGGASALAVAMAFTALPSQAAAAPGEGGYAEQDDELQRARSGNRGQQRQQQARQERQAPQQRQAPQYRQAVEQAQQRRADAMQQRAAAQQAQQNRAEVAQQRSGREWNRGDRRSDTAAQRSGRDWNRSGRDWNRNRAEAQQQPAQQHPWARHAEAQRSTERNRNYDDRERNRTYRDGRRDGHRSDDRNGYRHGYRDASRGYRPGDGHHAGERDGRGARDRDYRHGYRDASSGYRPGDGHHRWDRRWRQDNRYNWYSYRNQYRDHYRLGRYYSPYSNYRYNRLSIGIQLGSGFYGSRYWINDPWQYRLPEVYGPYRWVRYYDDVLLVNVYNGQVVDVIHDFFW